MEPNSDVEDEITSDLEDGIGIIGTKLDSLRTKLESPRTKFESSGTNVESPRTNWSTIADLDEDH